MSKSNYTEKIIPNYSLPLEMFISNDTLTEKDMLNNLKIKDKTIAGAVGHVITNNNNLDEFIKNEQEEREKILIDLTYLTAIDNVETTQ